MAEKFTPNCRYGHGSLFVITEDKNDTKHRFAVVNPDDMTQMFIGNVYVCLDCGYTEFFDDEPQKTANSERKKLRGQA
jgi:hypothetical protein